MQLKSFLLKKRRYSALSHYLVSRACSEDTLGLLCFMRSVTHKTRAQSFFWHFTIWTPHLSFWSLWDKSSGESHPAAVRLSGLRLSDGEHDSMIVVLQSCLLGTASHQSPSEPSRPTVDLIQYSHSRELIAPIATNQSGEWM